MCFTLVTDLFTIQGLPGPPGDIGPEGVIGRKVGIVPSFFLNLSHLAGVGVQKNREYI